MSEQREDNESEETVENVQVPSESVEKHCEISVGKISLDFIDGSSTVDDRVCPKSYFTLTEMEKMLLIYTEFFRRKYLDFFPHRNQLILAMQNECEVKKFVSTTIRPTVFIYSELIDSWNGPAEFVADFIKYEALENQLEIVSEEKTQNIFLLIEECFI